MKKKLFLLKRKILEFIFKTTGFVCLLIAFVFLVSIFTFVIKTGYKAFSTHNITLNIDVPKNINKNSDFFELDALIKTSFKNTFKTNLSAYNVLSDNAPYYLKNALLKRPEDCGKTVAIDILVSSSADMYLKKYKEASNNLTPDTVKFLDSKEAKLKLHRVFNYRFFSNPDSRYPEQAGIFSSSIGSIYTIFLTTLISILLSVATAIYLEFFAPKNALTSLITININNLAAVPSIVFGLLGLILFQGFFGIPRSSPLLASLVLSLISIPIIISSTRLALSSVPSYIKEAAHGIGSSKNQVIFNFILPMSTPGIITGVIIGISRVIGETAPLLIIGMFAFITNTKIGMLSPTTVLPVQILMWSDIPEFGYMEKASAAIIVLLTVLIILNIVASYIRYLFEKKFRR